MGDIAHKQGKDEGVFLAILENKVLGEMSYRMESPAVMAIEHTEVKESERGNNLGMELLDVAVAFARDKNCKIRPVCKFVNVMFEKNTAKYGDVNIN